MIGILKVIFVIIGTLIGAGFASGREIYIFFVKYGINGILGIIVSSVFIGIIIYKLLIKAKEKNINNYNELLKQLNKNYPKVNKFIYFIVNLFLLFSFFIMIACFSAFMNQLYSIPIYISSIIFCILCSIIFLNNVQGIIKANEILVPILIIIFLYLGLKNYTYMTNFNLQEFNKVDNLNWILKAILYVSYNSIILIPVLINLKLEKLTKKQIKKICIFSSLLIIIFSLIIFSLLLRGKYYIDDLELPLVEISVEFGLFFKYLYALVIMISIFTSSIGAGYSFLKNISKNEKQYFFYLIIISIIGILVSNIGFSKLVENIYPLFGLLGIIQIILIIK